MQTGHGCISLTCRPVKKQGVLVDSKSSEAELGNFASIPNTIVITSVVYVYTLIF